MEMRECVEGCMLRGVLKGVCVEVHYSQESGKEKRVCVRMIIKKCMKNIVLKGMTQNG